MNNPLDVVQELGAVIEIFFKLHVVRLNLVAMPVNLLIIVVSALGNSL